MEDFECEVLSPLGDEFSQKLDEDLDFAYALSLQSEFDEQNETSHQGSTTLREHNPGSHSNDFSEKIDNDQDYALALSLQSEFNNDSKENFQHGKFDSGRISGESQLPKHSLKTGSRRPASIVDEEWEVIDPIPNIHELFLQFNAEFFWGALAGVEVRWSPRMTLCAGICCYEGRGGLCSVRLSQPLLKYRPRRDLVETLLHEMIHAYLFVTHNNKDHDAHGPEFLKHMNRINQQTGTRITVYHSFHNEVDIHRKHWWKCNGPCQHRRPFYGLVKRAMNRAPSPRDPWWADHQAKCGGTFTKIKEPENFGQKKTAKRKNDVETSSEKDIRNFFTSPKKANIQTLSGALVKPQENGYKNLTPGVARVHTVSSVPKSKNQIAPFSGKGFVLGTGTSQTNNPRNLIPVKNGILKTSPNKMLHSKFDKKKPEFGATGPRKRSNSQSRVKGGRTAIMSRQGGSRTIVLPKTPKTKNSSEKVSPPEATVKTISFPGSGHVLGGSSNSITKESKTRTSPSTLLRQKSIDTFFESPSDTKSELSQKKQPFSGKKTAVYFSSDSEDDIVLENIRKTDTIKKEPQLMSRTSVNENLVDTHGHGSEFVCCPVCGTSVQNAAINFHLDNCLKNS